MTPLERSRSEEMSRGSPRWQIYCFPRRLQLRYGAGIACNAHLLPGDTIIPNNLTKPFQALSVPGPGADLPRDVKRSASLCRSAAMTPKMACELQGRVLADELFHPVERARRIRGMRLAGHEAVVGTLVELQFGVPAGLVVVGDKAAHQFHRDPLVSVAAKDQRRRQRALLAPL